VTSTDYDEDLDELEVEERPVVTRAYGVGLVVMGAVGLAAAFTLAWDKVKILENPSFRPSCDINPVLSCGSVMVTKQAQVFGFPNPFMGLVGFSIVVTIGVLVASGTRLPRWVLGGLALGSVAGLVLIHWLAFQSLYRIGALCPWCMVVWTMVIPTAVWTVLTAARQYADGPVLRGLWSVRYLIVAFWYLAFIVCILIRFWDYWSTLL
jgi:uncharacterized membrane protein